MAAAGWTAPMAASRNGASAAGSVPAHGPAILAAIDRRLFAAPLDTNRGASYCATVTARMAMSAPNSANAPTGTTMPHRCCAVKKEITIVRAATTGAP